MTEFLPIAFKLRDDTINGGLDWFKFYRLMGESLKRQDWRTCSGKLRDFNGLLEAALGRKQNASVNVPFKHLRGDMSCQSDNNKVFLAVANGDQELAQGLCRFVSPRFMDGAGYQSVFTEWEQDGGCSKRTEKAIGAPAKKLKR